MAVTVKKAALWRAEVADRPGALADVLERLAAAGADLRVVMGYGLGASGRAVIEVFPVSGRKAVAAATAAGLQASPIPCLLVEGDDRAGLGAQMASAIAAQGVNVAFVIAETIGRKFSAVFGFEDNLGATAGAKAIKAAAAGPKGKKK
jgi:hypothetical protein